MTIAVDHDIKPQTKKPSTPAQILFNQLAGFHLLTCFTSTAESSVDPDQLASQKPADLYLHCFQNKTYPGYTW